MLSCFLLGVMYKDGSGSQKIRVKWFLYPQIFGVVSACQNLGSMYYHGMEIRQNYRKARLFYQKSCDGGNMKACYVLGGMYLEGEGGLRNPSKAGFLYEKSCERGYVYACEKLK